MLRYYELNNKQYTHKAWTSSGRTRRRAECLPGLTTTATTTSTTTTTNNNHTNDYE